MLFLVTSIAPLYRLAAATAPLQTPGRRSGSGTRTKVGRWHAELSGEQKCVPHLPRIVQATLAAVAEEIVCAAPRPLDLGQAGRQPGPSADAPDACRSSSIGTRHYRPRTYLERQVSKHGAQRRNGMLEVYGDVRSCGLLMVDPRPARPSRRRCRARHG